jgi:type VI secretion system protein ImpK
VIELFYLCLSLGFQGRLRILPEGAADLATIRGRLHRIIRRRRGEVAAELSPHWRGISAPHRRLGARVPLWVVGTSVLAAVVLMFVGFRIALGTDSDALFDQVAGMPKIAQPRLQAIAVPPPPPPPAPRRVAGFLEPEIREGLVTVKETGQQVLVRLQGAGLFQAGSATLEARFLPVIERIGAALRDEPGPVTVIGYTDNQAIHSAQFPSNYELSLARADAVRTELARALGSGSGDRIAVDGRADSEPLADNATPQGREMNRRVEILVFRTKAEP